MAKKNRAKKSASPPPPAPVEAPSKSGGSGGRWVAIALVAVGAAVFVYASLSEGPPERESSRAATTASGAESHDHASHARDPGQTQKYRYFEDPAEAHPLPVTLPPSRFRNAGIANSYRIAKDIPEVLAQQPCLCGCDNTSDDHRSLLDCYIDEHASTCLVCMKEAVLAEQMSKAGQSAREIREAILRHEFSEVSIGN